MTTSESRGPQLTTRGLLLTTRGPWNPKPTTRGSGTPTENQGDHN